MTTWAPLRCDSERARSRRRRGAVLWG